ncbi:MAG: insulinase family protein [Candidatus Nephthysia bennettiae]|uniref:Insulinase family protein n=1 Tax=Candidatus Nephthysia bennettiae TaxID=3127016 RepID=A0A934N9S4_9BACT|nr:insulinase family protein [Candidatus Dormibacteraeota bacterium]MBJ7612348.1 insulinase family protein [Candidatus Dormibacteraeota bacterium]PZR92343.1 MAG: insulinase family protein [Candidatus Dormibacteraeota bacterium]
MGLAPNQSRHVLKGGAKLLTATLPDRASAALVLMLGVGSRFEDDRIGGISHFIEHLFFKGTRRRPSAKEIAEAIEGVGGVINASTDKEVTVYWTRVPADRVDLAADVLFDIVSNSQFAPDDVERERMVILEELKMYLDQPQDYVHSLFERIMWPDHPLGRDIIGTVESVSSTSRDDLLAYLQGHYRLPNLVMAISGAVQPDQALQLVESRLTLPEAPNGSMEFVPAPGPLTEPVVLLHRKDTEQAHICLGTRALSYLDPDRYALDLLNTILGEGMSSRLFLEIREKRGLAYDVHSFSSKHSDAGYFAVYMGVDPKKAEEAVNAVMEELRRVASEQVPEEELVKAKEFTKGRLRLGLEGTNSLATWLCQQELLTGRVKTVEEVVQLFEAVTLEELQRVAQRVLSQPVQLAVIGPFPSDGPFRSAIGA